MKVESHATSLHALSYFARSTWLTSSFASSTYLETGAAERVES